MAHLFDAEFDEYKGRFNDDISAWNATGSVGISTLNTQSFR